MPILSDKTVSEKKKKFDFVHAQARFICRYPGWILLLIALITALAVPFALRLKLHANFLDLLPPSAPSVMALKELTSRVGGTSFLIVVIESADEETARQAADLFAKKAAGLEGVEYVDNRTSVPAFESRKLLFLTLDSLKDLQKKIKDMLGYYRRKANPFYLDLVEEEEPEIELESFQLEEKVSRIGGFSVKDAKSFLRVVLIKPSHPVSDFVESGKLFDRCTDTFKKEVQKELKLPVTFGLTGPYRTRYNEYKTITQDLVWTSFLTLALITGITLFAFRNFRSLVYAYLPLVIGILWTWAFTQVTIGYLNLISAFLLGILMGMGGDYSLHLLVSFEDDLKITGNTEAAIEMTFRELWKPLWSSMLTTAAAFYAMTISQFEGFRHFGIIAGVGIVIAFAVVLYGSPALIILGERYFPYKRPPRAPRKKESKFGIYIVLIAGLLFTLFSTTKLKTVHFDYDFSNLQDKADDAIDLAERIGRHFGVHLSPVAFITPNRERATELAAQINSYIDSGKAMTFDFASAVTSHVPRNQEAKIAVLHEMEATLDKYKALIPKLDPDVRKKIEDLRGQLHAQPLGFEDLPSGIREQYEGKDQGISIVFVYPSVRIMNGHAAKMFIREIRSLGLPADIKLAGEPVIYADILEILERDTPIAMGISILTVFLLLFWHFKRIDHVLWVCAPVVLGFLWMVGVTGTTGLQYNFFNVAILPSILGVGIDNGIYIFDRYKEKRNEDFFHSMQKSTKGVLLSSATNISAFVSIMFGKHVGMASMGALGVYGFACCLLTSVYFVPALIEFFELKYQHLFKKGKRA